MIPVNVRQCRAALATSQPETGNVVHPKGVLAKNSGSSSNRHVSGAALPLTQHCNFVRFRRLEVAVGSMRSRSRCRVQEGGGRPAEAVGCGRAPHSTLNEVLIRISVCLALTRERNLQEAPEV